MNDLSSTNNPTFLEKRPVDYAFPLIALLFFITRLTHLTILPIFNDEAVYLHWAEMIREDFSDFLISVQADNKKPLQMWLIAIVLNLFSDPLQAGRFTSVLAGFGALLGVYFTGCRLHSTRAGNLAAFFYAISPYHLMFDRLIHESSLINCVFIWTIWLTLAVFDKQPQPRPLYAFLLFTLTGLGLLTISTAVLFIFLPLLFKLIFIRERKALHWKPMALAYLGGIGLGGFPYAVLYFTRENFPVKNFFIPTSHAQGKTDILDLILGIPIKVLQNLNQPLGYLFHYLTWPVCFLAVMYLFLQLKSLDRKTFFVAAYFLIPVFIIVGTASEGFSRYYLFCGTPLLLWAALAGNRILDILRQRASGKVAYAVSVILLASLSIPAVSFDMKLLNDPATAPFTERDRYQFVTSEFSGYGVPDAVNFLKQAAKENKITLLVSPDWGNPADALSVYFSRHSNIQIHMAWWMFQNPLLSPKIKNIPLHRKFTGEYLGDLHPNELQDVYFVTRTSAGFPRNVFRQVNGNFQLVQAFKKPGSTLFVEVYKLIK